MLLSQLFIGISLASNFIEKEREKSTESFSRIAGVNSVKVYNHFILAIGCNDGIHDAKNFLIKISILSIKCCAHTRGKDINRIGGKRMG